MLHSPVSDSSNSPDSSRLGDRTTLKAESKAESKAGSKSGQPHLRFQLPGSEPSLSASALIQMTEIQEVLSLPVQRLSPMPNMPSCVLGLMNRGNRIFWLVDLGFLLGLARLDPSAQQHHVMILHSGQSALGLAVQQVENMQWLGEAELQPKPLHLSPTLAPFVQSMASQHLVLDAKAILQAPILQDLVLR